MMSHFNLNIKMNFDVASLLVKLRENYEAHKIIVKEARAGYLAAAATELSYRLDQIRKGELVDLDFKLEQPESHTAVYETMISMLQDSPDKEIILSASEYRQLVLDEWDWRYHFLNSNKRYSSTADKMSKI